MTEYTVKELIEELSKFNPNAVILEDIDIGWTSDDGDGIWDDEAIRKSKEKTDGVGLINHFPKELKSND